MNEIRNKVLGKICSLEDIPIKKETFHKSIADFVVTLFESQSTELKESKAEVERFRNRFKELGICSCKNPVFSPPNKRRTVEQYSTCGRCKNMSFQYVVEENTKLKAERVNKLEDENLCLRQFIRSKKLSKESLLWIEKWNK